MERITIITVDGIIQDVLHIPPGIEVAIEEQNVSEAKEIDPTSIELGIHGGACTREILSSTSEN